MVLPLLKAQSKNLRASLDRFLSLGSLYIKMKEAVLTGQLVAPLALTMEMPMPGTLNQSAPAAAAAQSYMEGKPVEALAGGAAGLGTTALVRAAGRGIKGPVGVALQVAAPFVGLGAQQLAGGAAQSAYQRKTGSGDPTALSTQMGRIEKLQQLGLEGNIATLNAVNAGTKDMLTHISTIFSFVVLIFTIYGFHHHTLQNAVFITCE